MVYAVSVAHSGGIKTGRMMSAEAQHTTEVMVSIGLRLDAYN